MLLKSVFMLVWLSYARGDIFQPVSTTCIYWDSLTRYTNGEEQKLHCILDENGNEGLVNTTWILVDRGDCPYFNRHSKQIDTVSCDQDLGRCPDILIRSYQAVQFNACYGKGSQSERYGLNEKKYSPPLQVHVHDDGKKDKSARSLFPLVIVLIVVIVFLAIGLSVTLYHLMRKKQRKSRSQGGITVDKREDEAAPMVLVTNIEQQRNLVAVQDGDIDSMIERYLYNRVDDIFQREDIPSFKAITPEAKSKLAKNLTTHAMQKCERSKCGVSRNIPDSFENVGTVGWVNTRIVDGDDILLTFNFKAEGINVAKKPTNQLVNIK